MAASSTHPLLTKSIHGSQRGSIQLLDASPEDNVSIQAIQQWCALHKSDKHSDSDCCAQQEAASSNAAKKSSVNTKQGSKPCRLCFNSTSEKKKFLTSIEELEEVSLGDGSDDENIVEQILMQLFEVGRNLKYFFVVFRINVFYVHELQARNKIIPNFADLP